MGRKQKREGRDTDYVNNGELRELVIKYNDLNPHDDGVWLLKFERTMKTKGKWDKVKDWVEMRKKKYLAKDRKETAEFNRVSDRLFTHVYAITKGRVNCFPSIPSDEKEDLIQDCVLAVAQYINRYREDINSSAFAYITQIINNAIKLHMGQDNDSRWCRCPISEVAPENNRLYYGDTGTTEVEFEFEV